jgi:hypothetical protein
LDANQFQGAVLAWGSAATVTIGVLVALAVALVKGVNSIRDATVANATAVAAVAVKTDVHEKALNGALKPQIEAIADQRIALHRRPGDVATPVGPTAAPPA